MMSLLVLALCLISTSVVAANKEEKEALGCSADQLLSCIAEIESRSRRVQAFDAREHLLSCNIMIIIYYHYMNNINIDQSIL